MHIQTDKRTLVLTEASRDLWLYQTAESLPGNTRPFAREASAYSYRLAVAGQEVDDRPVGLG